MTTLMQPSCFPLKILYACAASVRGSSWVITCAHARMSAGKFLIVDITLLMDHPIVQTRSSVLPPCRPS